MTEAITSYTQSEGIATIAMDDGKANALSQQMLDELGAAFERAEREAKAVVLVGREGKFCGGFDLRQMMAGPAAAGALVRAGAEGLCRLYEAPLPVVIACTGHALAAGVLLLATGDTRIGALGPFKLGLNEVQNGMPVPIFAHELARDRLVPTELFASVVQSKVYDPEGAVQAGWLDRAVPADRLLEEARAEALRLSKLPKSAYGVSKRSLRRATIEHIRATVDENIAALLPT